MGILSKIFGEHAPTPAPLNHPSLGELRWQAEGWWEGVWVVDSAQSLEFAVSGGRTGPSGTLVSAIEATLSRWPDVSQQLQHFLASRESTLGGQLKPTSVSYLWPAKPDCFSIELALEGDEGAIWRVEFERGAPKHLSRDD